MSADRIDGDKPMVQLDLKTRILDQVGMMSGGSFHKERRSMANVDVQDQLVEQQSLETMSAAPLQRLDQHDMEKVKRKRSKSRKND